MTRATTRPWTVAITINEVDLLDWSVEPAVDDAEPLPLVRRRAAPRPRTLAGVGGPNVRSLGNPEVDDLTW